MRRWAFGLALVCAVAALGNRTERVVVTGASMEPTLVPGDRLLVWRTRRVEPGWIVVVPDPRDPVRPLVKRVTRVGAQAVELRGDNPSASTDSRVFGRVPVTDVGGRAIYRYHPPSRSGILR